MNILPIKVLKAWFTQDPPLVDLLLEPGHGFCHQVQVVLACSLPVHRTRLGDPENLRLWNLIGWSLLKSWLCENCREKRIKFECPQKSYEAYSWQKVNPFYNVLIFNILVKRLNRSNRIQGISITVNLNIRVIIKLPTWW